MALSAGSNCGRRACSVGAAATSGGGSPVTALSAREEAATASDPVSEDALMMPESRGPSAPDSASSCRCGQAGTEAASALPLEG